MDMDKFVKDGQLKIYVKPNSKKTLIAGYDEERDALRINVKAPPEDNKANIEIIKYFSKMMKRPIAISKGLKSKEKYLRIG